MTDLAQALDVALAAARDAAALLRAEFFRPGGPRGEGGHCPADCEAEDLIRAALGAAFPDHGVVGEERPERDRPPRDGAGHVWVIDPNDGTADFLAGLRGAAVSIALIRDGLPVLGVVLAHTAPEGGEDLFSWVEGSGPVLRNGAPLPALVDAPLGPRDVVLVSSGGARRVLANVVAVHPARFRPMTSIAYRLALAAAGEAVGGVSLHRPRPLDIMAGHALLRGAGGALVDERGRELRYGRDGAGVIRYAFGGAPSVALALSRRDWDPAELGPPTDPGLARPIPGRAVFDVGLLRRAQGTLLGQLAGDALGSLVEFEPREAIEARFPGGVRELEDGGTWDTLAGQPTDDSEMALALARSLVELGRFDEGSVAEAYARWYRSGPFDAGETTRAALEHAARALAAGQRGEEVARAARTHARTESLANGALMRIAPLGIQAHAAAPADVAAWARADAALTHPNRICQDASAVYAAAVAFAVATAADAGAVAEHAASVADVLDVADEVKEAVRRGRAGERPDYLTRQGLVTVALQNAFAQLGHARSLEEGLVDTVGRGGDTDTNAAIAGALLGAVHGVRAIPARWRRLILSCWPVAGAPGVLNPRPPACWPVDALVLAERLAAGGGDG